MNKKLTTLKKDFETYKTNMKSIPQQQKQPQQQVNLLAVSVNGKMKNSTEKKIKKEEQSYKLLKKSGNSKIGLH